MKACELIEILQRDDPDMDVGLVLSDENDNPLLYYKIDGVHRNGKKIYMILPDKDNNNDNT